MKTALPFPVNWPIAYLAFWFWLTETLYFGLNWWPDSVAELLADGIVFLLVGLAIAFGPPVKPRLTLTRVLTKEHRLLSVMIAHDGQVEVVHGKDVQL